MKTYARIENGRVVEIIDPFAYQIDIIEQQPSTNPDGSPGPLVDVIIHHIGDEVLIEDRFPPEIVATMVDITGIDPEPQQGWVYSDGTFAPYTPPPPTPEQILSANLAMLQYLSTTAATSMAPILVSLQLGDATDQETINAKAWQTYYRALQVVDLTVANPIWPTPPDQA